jgi:acyl carrier protein
MKVTSEEIMGLLNNAGVVTDLTRLKGDESLRGAGVDSIEMMNLFLQIEESYSVKIPDEDVDALDSIDAIVAYLQKF